MVRKDTRLGRTSQSILIWPSVAPCLCFCHPGNKKGLIGRVGIEGVLEGSLEEDFFLPESLHVGSCLFTLW